MTNFLVKLFIKNKDDIGNPHVRQAYGMLGGAVGIVCNLLLFAGKLFAGIITGAISITADAFNNLSDAGSSVVTLIGFKMAGKPADHEHPFGHGRIEYLSGLLVSLAIMLVGVELIKSSLDKIFHPEMVSFSKMSVLILIVSVCIKMWMALFNRTLGNRIHSAAMKATSADSMSDCVATTAVIIGIFISYITGYSIDGYAGIAVALFILYAGFSSAKDTLQPLLGQAPDPEFVKEIEKRVLSHQEITGIHDLIVHDYGPGRIMVSLHAEIPYNIDILQAHDVIDGIEFDLKKEFNCDVTIHMDPIVTDDSLTNEMRIKVSNIVNEIDPCLSMHDFRMTQGPLRMNLIFDVVVPFDCRYTPVEVQTKITAQIKQMDENYYPVIEIDQGYV